MQYVNLAVMTFAQRKRGLFHRTSSPDLRDTQPVKRDSYGQIKHRGDGFKVPFGQHLIPVKCQEEEPKKTVPADSCNAAVSSQEDCSGSAKGKHTCGAHLTRCSSCDCVTLDHGTSEQCSKNNQGLGPSLITTNDLLDCLVHPDIISRVTELLLERHRGRHL
ncbi:hypothetical protein CHARACLAT_032845 [Characodon lateralis]|uniref:Uncharacterized protein n=1 Tax=Characodon lateralis TaxID=208331 RepID=A0ABU7D606_9TELE|nr:hypothetical protein [Characodon lateralis]